MKQNIKSLVSGIVIGSLLTGGITFAKTGNETLEAWYSNIKLYINGTQLTPKDANGNPTEPFIVNGTTYLPIRAVGEALEKDVRWDGTTNSVYLTDKTQPTPKPTETIEPEETPQPTVTPTETPKPTELPAPTEYSYTTKQILQISGYREKAIKGEVTTAWDSNSANAVFQAKMRCNNGGLADYVDCEITLTEVISTKDNGFTGYFNVSMNDSIRHKNIKGTVTVEGTKLSLHTEEYDYKLTAMLPQSEEPSKTESATFYSLQATSFDGKKATGLIGLDFSQDPSAPDFSGTFTAGEQSYTLELNELTSVSDNQMTGVFSVICDGEPLVDQANGTIKNLSAPLGEVMELTIEDFATLQLRVVEIGY
ncbi:MAG: hypothetical protein J6A61_06780 [Clostridia bacterium]|nr:hypothetical protein [Clostridia bacterium]